MIKNTLIAIAFIFSGIITANNSISIVNMRCDYRENPIAVDNEQPVFSWRLHSSSDSIYQKAYEIIVSDCIDEVQRNIGDKWNSKIINSSNNNLIVYKGVPLESFVRYYWRVRVYDIHGNPSNWSEIAWFDTAMLKDSDWTAKWISDGSNSPMIIEDFYKDDPAPLFGKEFSVGNQVESAKLYISGLGYYEAYLNGEKISPFLLDAGWTAYDHQVLYNVYDITHLLRDGVNDFGAIVGNGWYNLLPLKFWGRHIFRDALASGRPTLKAQLLIQYVDGSVDIIPTDESWKVTKTPILRNSIFLGEFYDATLEDENWYGLKNITSGWIPATIIDGPKGKMTVQTSPAITVYKEIKPASITKLSDGKYIVDMGENFAGIVRLNVNGAKGQKISLRYGEDIHQDGTVNVMTSVAGQIKKPGIGGPGAPDIAWQEDNYVLKGIESEEWQPKFTFHSFRYVEVSGWPGILAIDNIKGLALAADLDRTGSFSSSNPMFNELFEVIDRTFLSNVFSVQSDCPAREKLGYGGDIVATAESYLYNYDMHTFYRKTIRDFANDQRENGGITETAPYVGISDAGPDKESGPLGWQLAYPYLVMKLYEFYGDSLIISNNYDNLERHVEFLIRESENDLYTKGLSDHEALNEKPVSLTSSLFYYHHIRLFAEFSAILNKEEKQKRYNEIGEVIRRRIMQHFIQENGTVDNSTQTAQVFALWYKIVDDKILLNNIITKLKEAFDSHDWHVSTGIFGTKMLFDVLRILEKEDWAYKIANQRTFPGWGYMLDQGATTLWETWAYSDNVYSQNHPMFGSINEWFYRSILGINPLAPGFKEILIKPQIVGDLTWAKGHYQSIHGKIASEWKIDNDQFYMNITIPPNTTAEVWLPKNYEFISCHSLLSNKKKSVLRKMSADNSWIIQVGSGSYSFHASLSK